MKILEYLEFKLYKQGHRGKQLQESKRRIVEKLIKQLQSEISDTGGAPGYSTPLAFAPSEKAFKKNTKKIVKHMTLAKIPKKNRPITQGAPGLRELKLVDLLPLSEDFDDDNVTVNNNKKTGTIVPNKLSSLFPKKAKKKIEKSYSYDPALIPQTENKKDLAKKLIFESRPININNPFEGSFVPQVGNIEPGSISSENVGVGNVRYLDNILNTSTVDMPTAIVENIIPQDDQPAETKVISTVAINPLDFIKTAGKDVNPYENVREN